MKEKMMGRKIKIAEGLNLLSDMSAKLQDLRREISDAVYILPEEYREDQGIQYSVDDLVAQYEEQEAAITDIKQKMIDSNITTKIGDMTVFEVMRSIENTKTFIQMYDNILNRIKNINSKYTTIGYDTENQIQLVKNFDGDVEFYQDKRDEYKKKLRKLESELAKSNWTAEIELPDGITYSG